MTEVKEPTVITVAETRSDNFGNLYVTDTTGGVTKITKGHSGMFPLFQQNVGRAVKLQWRYYSIEREGKTYSGFSVDNADLFDGVMEDAPEPVPSEKLGVPTIPAPPPVVTSKPTEIPGAQIGMTVKEVGDMIRADKLWVIFGEDAAKNLTVWYRGQILGTARINFDGKDLPK